MIPGIRDRLVLDTENNDNDDGVDDDEGDDDDNDNDGVDDDKNAEKHGPERSGLKEEESPLLRKGQSTEDSINSFDYTVEILMLRMSTKELPLGYYRINYTPVDTTKNDLLKLLRRNKLTGLSTEILYVGLDGFSTNKLVFSDLHRVLRDAQVSLTFMVRHQTTVEPDTTDSVASADDDTVDLDDDDTVAAADGDTVELDDDDTVELDDNDTVELDGDDTVELDDDDTVEQMDIYIATSGFQKFLISQFSSTLNDHIEVLLAPQYVFD